MGKPKIGILLSILILLVLFNAVFALSPPVASIEPTMQDCTINQKCEVIASGIEYQLSFVPGEGYVEVETAVMPQDMKLDWSDGLVLDFGNLSSYVNSHKYTNAGDYTVKLWVRDSFGNVSSPALSIAHVVTNQPPVAKASPDGITVLEEQTVEFSSLGSYDPDGSIAGYDWDFGDTQKSTDRHPAHSYSNAGTYTATLTVTDNGNPQIPLQEKLASDSTIIKVTDGSGIVRLPGKYGTVDRPIVLFNLPIVKPSYPAPGQGVVDYICSITNTTSGVDSCWLVGAFEKEFINGGIMGHCNAYSSTETFPRYTYFPNTEGTYTFKVTATEYTKSILIGNISMVGKSWNGIYNIGPLRDSNFRDTYFLGQFDTTMDTSAGIKEVTYSVYRNDDCVLTKVAEGNMTVVGDTLSTRLEKPPCNELECKYYGEISIYTDKNGTKGYGGGIFEFTFENTPTGFVEIEVVPPTIAGTDVTVLAEVGGLGDADIYYEILSPEGYPAGEMSLVEGGQYSATFPLTKGGFHMIQVTATSLNQTWNTAVQTETFDVGTYQVAEFTLLNDEGEAVFFPGSGLYITLQNFQFQGAEDLGLEVKGILYDSSKSSIETFDMADFEEDDCGEGCYKYTTDTVIPIAGKLGNYTVMLEVGIGNDTEYITKSIVVGGAGALKASPASIDFGMVEPQQKVNKTVTITNIGTAPITNITMVLSNKIAPLVASTISKDSLFPQENLTISLSSVVLEGMQVDTYEGTLTVSSPGVNGTTAVIPVSLTIKPEINTTIVPDQIYVAVPTGTEVTKSVNVTVTGTSDTIDMAVNPSGAISNAVVAYDDEVQGGVPSEVLLAFTMPAGPFDGSLEFEFSYKGSVLHTASVDVTGTPGAGEALDSEPSLQDKIDELRGDITRLRGKLANIRAQAGVGKHAAKIEVNATVAEGLLDSAEQSLLDAEGALDAGDEDDAELYIESAEDDISAASRIISMLERLMAGIGQNTKGGGLSIIWVIFIILAIFGFIIFALREGWIPADKVPWLVSMFEAMGLGWLIGEASVPQPKPRFKGMVPAKPAPIRGPPQPVKPIRPVHRKPGPQSMAAKWQEYYRRHPEYARRMHQRYTTYYQRRYH